MLLSFDVAAEAMAEHDEWHTHEHLPERLSIPGFLRGTRWVTMREQQPRYLVLYEVTGLATLTSEAYLDRLNHPSAWTARMMAHYRGMRRGLCTVTCSLGLGMGNVAALLRFRPAPVAALPLRRWLLDDALPSLPSRRGIGSVHLLEAAEPAPMTAEQRIRGADASIDWALLLTAYSEEALTELVQRDFDVARLERRGAEDVVDGLYRIHYSLTREELAGKRSP